MIYFIYLLMHILFINKYINPCLHVVCTDMLVNFNHNIFKGAASL